MRLDESFPSVVLDLSRPSRFYGNVLCVFAQNVQFSCIDEEMYILDDFSFPSYLDASMQYCVFDLDDESKDAYLHGCNPIYGL